MAETYALCDEGTPATLTPREGGQTAVVVAATVLAAVLRIYQLTRPGFLHGVTEYDDGVYFGSAVALIHGHVPYRDFVLVQPPGVVLLMTPVAWLTGGFSTSTGLALARILTAGVGVAAIPLAGRLVRGRGTLAATIVCGFLAVYPAGINAAHTLLLEPWLVLFCLLGMLLLFEGDLLTVTPARLAAAGVAFGLAVSVKLWGALPLAVALLLCLRGPGRRQTGWLCAGAAGSLALAVLPLAASAPHSFLRAVIEAQLRRTDVGRVSVTERLTTLTGLGVFAPVSQAVVVLGAVLLLAVIIGATVATWRRERRAPAPLEAFALITAGLVVVLFMWPADFFPHYGWFLAPFLALAIGLPVGRLQRRGGGRGAAAVALTTGAACLLVAGLQLHQLSRLNAQDPAVAAHRTIPAGACVLTDLTSMTLSAGRFISRVPGCPTIIDGLGTDLALSLGRIGTNGAGRTPAVERAWLGAFRQAGYVWLQCRPDLRPRCPTPRRIAWTPAIRRYLAVHFRLVRSPGAPPNLYVRRRA